jgi:hypothetical protein
MNVSIDKIYNIKEKLKKLNLYYIEIYKKEDIDIIYNLYLNNIIPNLEEIETSIICIYLSFYYKKVLLDEAMIFECLEKGKTINDENVKWVYFILGEYRNDLQILKKAYKLGCKYAVYSLLAIKQKPKYFIEFTQLYGYNSYKIMNFEFYKKAKKIYDELTPDYIELSFIDNYKETEKEYNDVLNRFGVEHPIYNKYYLDLPDLEEYDIYKEYKTILYDGKTIFDKLKIAINEKNNLEDIQKEISEAYNWINHYSVKTKRISLNLYKSVKEEYWKCIYWMEKMDKYKNKLLEEIELIPNIGSKYLEAEYNFNLNRQ